mmetsp:Transcript_23442/g.73530  ORF Transcript_23442/g.73530 Transcript_23442/m.73530 type:complete len:681 (-) Transcript_23442:1043-3085(-)
MRPAALALLGLLLAALGSDAYRRPQARKVGTVRARPRTVQFAPTRDNVEVAAVAGDAAKAAGITPRPQVAAADPEPWMASAEDSRIITGLVMKSATPEEVSAVLFANAPAANHYTICAAVCRLAKQPNTSAAEARRHARRVLEVLSTREVLERLDTRQLTNVVWSTAKLRLKKSEVRVFAEALGRQLLRGEPAQFGEMSMALWGVATAGVSSGGFDRGLGRWFNESMPLLGGANATATAAPTETPRVAMPAPKGKDVAIMVWSLARMGKRVHPEAVAQLAQLANQAVERRAFNAKDVSMMAWGFGTILEQDYRHEEAVVPTLDQLLAYLNVRSLKSRDLAQILTGISRARYDGQAFMREVGRSDGLPKLLRSCAPQELCSLVYSYARLYVLSAPFFRAVEEELCHRGLATRSGSFDRLNAQELSNLAWALTVVPLEELDESAGILRDNTVKGVLEEAATRKDLLPLHRRQLHQAVSGLRPPAREVSVEFQPEGVLDEAAFDPRQEESVDDAWLDLEAVPPRRTPVPFGATGLALPNDFARLLQREWTAEKARVKRSSARHKSVSHALVGLGILHENERDEDITIKNLGIALEVDGPDHYTRYTHRLLGHTRLKRRVLRAKGWRVVSIPWFEFDRIPFWSSMERKRYVQRRIGLTKTIKYNAKDFSTYKPYPQEGQTKRTD